MNKVKFGLSNVHLAPFTYDGSKYTYGDIIKIPGAVSLSLEPSGDTADFYADNVIYFSSTANQGYEGSLELAMITDEIREKILGETKDKNGAFIESSKDINNSFAFGFQIEGDKKGRRFWYYNCSMSRPNNNASTTESTKDPATDTLNIKTMPRITDNRVRVFLTETTENEEAYNSFFDTVYEEVKEA